MTFWLTVIVVWLALDALIVGLLMALSKFHHWRRHRKPVKELDFTLASDLAKQRPARVIRQATAYRRQIDR